jgi:ABC-2 type transport system permease protein
LRYLYSFRTSIDRLTEAFYWPIIDLLLWGLTASYFASQTKDPNAVQAIVFGVMLWSVVWRGQFEISINFLEELWNKNLVNLFVSPLSFAEWLIGLMILSIFKVTISLTVSAICAYIFFGINVFQLSWTLFVFPPLLLIASWWVGCLLSSIVMRYGTSIQAFSWTLPWLLTPFSLAFFPSYILPVWAQQLSKFVPTSYVFNNLRQFLYYGTVNWNELALSLFINLILLTIGIAFYKISYDHVLRTKGLIKIT